MKAIKVASEEARKRHSTMSTLRIPTLFDARPPRDSSRPGGHGTAFDWHILDGIKARLPFMLSGGLTPDNVAEAIRITGAPMVDVSSGWSAAQGRRTRS